MGNSRVEVAGLFAFLLAVTEVHVKLSSEHFGRHEDKGMIVFHKQFAWELINNDYLKRGKLLNPIHQLIGIRKWTMS